MLLSKLPGFDTFSPLLPSCMLKFSSKGDTIANEFLASAVLHLLVPFAQVTPVVDTEVNNEHYHGTTFSLPHN